MSYAVDKQREEDNDNKNLILDAIDTDKENQRMIVKNAKRRLLREFETRCGKKRSKNAPAPPPQGSCL